MSDQDYNLSDPIFEWAQRTPHAAAIIEGDQHLDYAGLCNAVRRAAHRFRDAGWNPGDIVGVSIRGRETLHLVIALALARIGVIQVTLSPNELAAARLSLAQTLRIRATVGDHEHDRLSGIAHLAAHDDWLSEDPTLPVAADIRAAGGDAVWIILESSGTTAVRKNIRNSHHFHRIVAERFDPVFGVFPGERVASLTGFRFRMGLSRALYCLSQGGTFVTAPRALTPTQLLHWINASRIDSLNSVPTHLFALLEDSVGDAPRLPGMRILRCSGGALPVSAVHRIREQLTPNLYLAYGTNEVGSISAATPAILDRYPDSVGLPFSGIELEIVDDDGRPVPAGTVGHIRVRGAGIDSSALLGSAQLEQAAFRQGWFYPGDTASVNREGMIFLQGRSDEVLNFDGILIGPLEIEAAVARHPAVAEVAAFALPSPRHQDVPVAAVVLKYPLPLEELHRYCAELLGIRAPREYFVIDAIPKSPIGKVLRRRLVELALAHIKTRNKPV